ncbi:MAG: cbb3-type cytochrome oxidase assembly protein CcoS [Burkholderiaceae bacterium]|nr:cbb3-type cytochrome oxidase assembly protein CcoS [Burkholderiaceae bacterium]
MEALYLLVPLSLAIVALAAWIFLRMSDSGQFDDMEGPAHSILHDDDRSPPATKEGTDDDDNARS